VKLSEMQLALADSDAQLVFLSACGSGVTHGVSVFNGIAPALIRIGIPAVVAMQASPPDGSSTLFVQRFYDALAKGTDWDDVAAAVGNGRRAIFRPQAGEPVSWFMPCAVDLHVHTPASKCFLGTVTPEAYVAQAIEAGMQAIAITDHNTGDWIDQIKEAATGTALTVFPGVEISVQPGVHILAIFPESRGGAHVNDLLAKLHLGADDRGEQEALVTKYGPQEVVAMIRNEGALPILAHIDDYKGAWRELSGQTRIKLWQAAEFAAVEIVGERLPDDIGREPYAYKPAYYWASDNPHPENHTKHSHLGIGQRYSLFKMDEQQSVGKVYGFASMIPRCASGRTGIQVRQFS
jgi:hypothetical protein